MDDKRIRMLKLVEELNIYANAYYVQDNHLVSDKEYDEKYDELIGIEKELGEILPLSPSQRIGGGVLPGFSKYTHKAKLWSLDKAQSLKEIEEWHNRNIKVMNEYNLNHQVQLDHLTYVLTKKFDGLTVNATYNEEGYLIKAASRGTGVIGEDITAQAKTIKTLPLQIEYDAVIEVHGEAIMTKRAFEKYNETSATPLKNLRNGAAGALRNLNVRETSRRGLSAFFYDVGYNEGTPFKTYIEMMDFIKRKHIPIDEYIAQCETLEEIEKEIVHIEAIRADLEYDIDGVVIAINDIRTREVLGYTIKFPKWAIAYKFEAEEATTTLLDVVWNVGRSGRVAPTAILAPVGLAGATVKRATLNNIDDINRKGVKIGCDVFVRRSNDVIPEIMGVVDSTIEKGIDIIVPEICPSCGSELVRDGVHYFCDNTLSCMPQMVKSIVHYGSREAMNIGGFSEKTAQQLFEKLGVKAISELYKLEKDKLLVLEKFGEKKAGNLINSIENSKNCSLDSFIYALGIPNVGKKTAKDLANRFKNLENIKGSVYEDLINVQDIGDIVARSIMEFFSQDKIIESISELLELGVNPIFEETLTLENIFMNKTMVVTGTLASYSRIEIKEKLEALGVNIAGTVSKKTDYVLVGEDPGSKYDKAILLGVKVLNEEEFEQML
ncbi:MAG: NAD-dependent DNA ligase LigA [Clostridium sp.]|uniref:NAD-dependent DNA ligase LigA n=1 Tax=Clostridium sp. TaxID=1506 RepID=UPI003D6C78EE